MLGLLVFVVLATGTAAVLVALPSLLIAHVLGRLIDRRRRRKTPHK
jgi:hypothetical protein